MDADVILGRLGRNHQAAGALDVEGIHFDSFWPGRISGQGNVPLHQTPLHSVPKSLGQDSLQVGTLIWRSIPLFRLSDPRGVPSSSRPTGMVPSALSLIAPRLWIYVPSSTGRKLGGPSTATGVFILRWRQCQSAWHIPWISAYLPANNSTMIAF